MTGERDARGRILGAAEVLFASKGYDATTVREISKASGMNLSMIHYYFGNKEGLYRAIFEDKVVEMQQMLSSATGSPGTCRERIELFIQAYARFICDDPSIARIIQREMLNRGAVFEEIFRPQVVRNFAMIKGLVAEGVARGEFREVDVNLTPISLVGMIVFFAIAQPLVKGMLGVGPGDEAFDGMLARHTVDLAFRGLLTPAGSEDPSEPGPE